MKETTAIRPEQLPALFKYFIRTGMVKPAEPDEDVIQSVRHTVTTGDTDWVMNKSKLANVMTAAQL